MLLGCLSAERKENFTVDLLQDLSGLCKALKKKHNTTKKLVLCLVFNNGFQSGFL